MLTAIHCHLITCMRALAQNAKIIQPGFQMAPKLFKVVYSSSKYCDLKTLQILHCEKNNIQQKKWIVDEQPVSKVVNTK